MKKLLPILFVAFITSSTFAQTADLPENTGDNFSLEGALALFKKAKSVEDFETLINDESNNVNNLDLNNDGKTDYISVEDITENNTHVLVLSTDLSATEKQDIATINIEKTANDEATLQIIGDNNLYAENTIAEPFDTTESVQNYKGPSAPKLTITRLFVNVWFWPSVRFMYAPTYVIWRSPYRWAFYPRWYRPWRPFGYRNFYARCAPHRIYYHRTPTYRVISSRKLYAPRRHYATVIVRNPRNTTVIRNRSYYGTNKNYQKHNRIKNTSNVRMHRAHSTGRGRR